MKINDVIRTRRQALGLTQEGLADRLGVSAPAVNKWEKGLNYPDITLLPALARTLGVDLNTLLSFQEDMTREEISLFVNLLAETAQAEGCGAAFQLARDKLREFPNSDLLAYNTACLLEGSLAICSGGSEEERAAWQRELSAIYERSVRSSDLQVRENAVYTVASRCIREGDLDRAEALLAQLPDTHRDKKLLTASLREKQERWGETWELLELELFNRAHGVQLLLLQMIGFAGKEGDWTRARSLAETAEQVGRAMQLPEHVAQAAFFQVSMAEGDGPRALEQLDILLNSMTRIWDLENSRLYPHMKTKLGGGGTQEMLLQTMLDQLERDPEVQFLKNAPGYEELVEKYRRA